MEAIAFLDGEFIPANAARLPVHDLGVAGGLAVSEMLRTFRHQPFRVESHLARLEQSLSLTGFVPTTSAKELERTIRQVVAHNTALIADDDDLGVIVFVTAGWNPTYVGAEAATAHGLTVGVHTFPLQYGLWAAKYRTGVRMAVASIPALPGTVIDRRVKSRSRMHWHLADRAVKSVDPLATALLTDADGSITETAAANVCAVIDGVLMSPPPGTVLEGVSLQVVWELAAHLGLKIERRRLYSTDLGHATEIFLTTTPSCLLPVTVFNGQIVGDGRPGSMFQQLLWTWGELVAVDIQAQAMNRSR